MDMYIQGITDQVGVDVVLYMVPVCIILRHCIK
jgi:hypothetical protein